MPETIWQSDFTNCYKRLAAAQQASVLDSIELKLKSWNGRRSGSIRQVKNIWELDILGRRYRLLFCEHGNAVWLLNIVSKQNGKQQSRLIERYSREHSSGH